MFWGVCVFIMSDVGVFDVVDVVVCDGWIVVIGLLGSVEILDVV